MIFHYYFNLPLDHLVDKLLNKVGHVFHPIFAQDI
jgi:hypothetical protein